MDPPARAELTDPDADLALLAALCRRDAATLAGSAALARLDDPATRDRFEALASRHGVLGLVLSTIARNRLLASDAPAAHLLRHLRPLGHRAFTLEVERDRVLWTLAQAGVPTVVLKGAALATTVYADRAERDYGDIDLLVPEGQADLAASALVARGFARSGSAAEEEAYREHHFHLRVQRPGGTIVEPHWALTQPREPWHLDPAAFLAGSVEVPGARGMRVPRPEHMLLHMAVENVRDRLARLTRLVDIDRIVSSSPTLDWDFLRAEASRGGLRSALALVLGLARGVLGTAVPASVREDLRPGATARFHLALLRPASSLLRQRSSRRPAWGELLTLWILDRRARRLALGRMLRGDDGDPLAWMWDGDDGAPAAERRPVGTRLLRVGKMIGYQLGLYAGGIAATGGVRAEGELF